jgi:demethylmenaquinone methyltransferase / 2-methoxy-6-polyprenyl-1,4-benzoquinol methylase
MNQQVYDKTSPQSIQELFGSIAAAYDRTNSLVSLGLHKKWNQKLAYTVFKNKSPQTLLDLCCGTGEISLTYLKKCSLLKKVTLLDFCPEMLKEAKRKFEEYSHKFPIPPLEFLQADAQQIPLLENSVDAITIAYGIRNVKDTKQCMKECWRVLNPEGMIAILELTRPNNNLLGWAHKKYLSLALPVMGKISSKNGKAYKYLSQSIHDFTPPQTLEKMLEDQGFSQVKTIPLYGGIASILTAYKEK